MSTNQPVTDGIQEADMERLRFGETRQNADFAHIEDMAKKLGELMTAFSKEHRLTLSIATTHTISRNEQHTTLFVRPI
jgi:hypothetical protein